MGAWLLLLSALALGQDADELDAEMERLYGAGQVAEAHEVAAEAVAIRRGVPGDPNLSRSLNNLAAMKWALGEFGAAAELYGEALELWEESLGPDHIRVAALHNNLGVLRMELGQLEAAEGHLAVALEIRERELGPDDEKVATTLGNYGSVLSYLARHEDALEVHQRAVDILTAIHGPEHVKVADVLDALSDDLHAVGQYGAASAAGREALRIRERALGPDHPDVAIGAMSLGSLLEHQAKFSDAEEQFERALAIFTETLGGNHPAVGKCLHNLSLLTLRVGQVERARLLAEESLAILEAAYGPEHHQVAQIREHLSHVFRAQDNREEAAYQARLALDIRLATFGMDHPETARSYTDLAMTADDLADSEAYLESALSILTNTMPAGHVQIAATRVRLGAVIFERDPQAGRPLVRDAMEDLRDAIGEDHPWALDLSVRSAEILTDDLNSAIELIQDISEQFKDILDSDPVRLAQLHRLSVLLDRAGRKDEWNAVLAEALNLSNKVMEDLAPALSEREAFEMLQEHRDIFDWAITETPENKVAWDLVIQWKGLVRRSRRGDSHADPQSAEIAAQLAVVRRELSSRVLRGGSDDVRQLMRQKERLEREIAAARGETRHPRASDVCARIPEGAVLVDLIDYKRGDVRHFDALVIDGGCDPVRVALGPSEPIDIAATNWSQVLAVRDDRGLPAPQTRADERGRRVSELIWEPLAPHLDAADHVIVVPDRTLASIPWGALPIGEGRYLVEDHLITYLAASTDLLRDSVETGEGLLAVGGLDFGDPATASERLLAMRSSGCNDGQWAPLPGTSVEVHAVAQRYRRHLKKMPLILTDTAATERRLDEVISRHRFVHLATHGFYASPACTSYTGASEHPMVMSGLVLSSANRPREAQQHWDGILTGEEVSNLDLRGTELVVLSGCETGLGSQFPGEGVLGLRRAFAQAGAQSTIMSLWAVTDVGTSELMSSLYEKMWRKRRPLSAAQALRQVQLEILDESRESGDSSPGDWAGFILSGT